MSDTSENRHSVHELEAREWPGGVTSAVLSAASVLGAAEPGTAVTFVVRNAPEDPAVRDCLREALRGLIHSSVLENPRVRANLAFGGSSKDSQAMTSYLETASFVFGATFDLGSGQ
jgi:hypothetical protein